MIEIEKAEEYRCCKENRMPDICGDNRFEIIAEAKKDLLETTNIGTSHAEMSVLDNFLFRCWQMGWLRQYETFEFCARGEQPCKEYDQEKHCCHRWTKVIRQSVEEMKNQGQWTSVTEALPEEGRYLVTRYDYVTKSSFIDILWFEKNTWWNRHFTGDYAVRAWMPLPEVWRSKE